MKNKITLYLFLIVCLTSCTDEIKLSKDLDGTWNTVDSLLTLTSEDNEYEYELTQNNRYELKDGVNLECDNQIESIIINRNTLYYNKTDRNNELKEIALKDISIKCSPLDESDTLFILKDINPKNIKYFSKYLVFKENKNDKTLILDTTWKNSKFNRSGIIYKFKYSEVNNTYKDDKCGGEILIEKALIDEELLLETILDLEIEDIDLDNPDYYCIITDPQNFDNVSKELESKGMKIEGSISLLPSNTIQVSGSDVSQLFKLLDILEDHEDIQKVYSNFSIDDKDLNNID